LTHSFPSSQLTTTGSRRSRQGRRGCRSQVG
jgi:hypothetical protein